MGEPQTMSPLGAPETPDGLPTGGRRRDLTLPDFRHLDFVEEVFLPEVRARGVLTPQQERALEGVLADLMSEASGGLVPHPERIPATATVERPTASRVPAVADSSVEAAVFAPPLPSVEPRPPSRLRLWWDRTVEAVGSDLAVHGLAYLGVLLFFVGAFGLVAFAFGDVAPTLRPLAEIVIAAAPFAAGALLRRRRATFVGRALELAGGLVLPIMVVTSFLDGVAVPPDIVGTPLVVVLTVLVAALAVGYAAWSRRVPDSALRFLVAPLGWLAVGLATMGVGQAIPAGKAVAVPSVWQASAMTVALAASVVWARLRPNSRWAAPTLVAAVPGLVVLATLAVLTWAAGAWPPAAVIVAGVAALVVLEALSPRLPAVVVGIAEPLWWLGVCVTLDEAVSVHELPYAVAPATGVVGYVVVLELAAAARRPGPAHVLAGIGLALSLFAMLGEPGWAVPVLASTTVWATWRRARPYAGSRAARTFDLATVLLALSTVGAAAMAWDERVALLVAGGFMALLAYPAARGWLDRSTDDPYWSGWFAVGIPVITIGVLAEPITPTDSAGVPLWQLAAAAALLALASGFGPFTSAVRPSAVAAPATVSWLWVASALDLSSPVASAVPALVALALVVVAHWPPRRLDSSTALGMGAAGLGLGTAVALLALPTDWGVVVAMAGATAGWGLTGWRDAVGRSGVGTALRRVMPFGAWVPLGLAALGLPVTLFLLADRVGWLPLDSPWSATLLAGVAMAYAAVSRLHVPDRVAATAARAAFVGGVIAPALAGAVASESVVGTQSRTPTTVALGALMVVVPLIPAARRDRIMTWVAWVAPAPAALLLGQDHWRWLAGLPTLLQVAVALVGVGGVLLVGAAALDLRWTPWEPRPLPGRSALRPAALVGATEVLLAVVLAAVAETGADVPGRVSAAAALAAFAAALLMRAGILAGTGVVVGWWSGVQLVGPALEARPWISAIVAAVLLVAAQVLSASRLWTHRGRHGSAWWSRWDLGLLLAAGPVAATGVALSGTGTQGDLTYVMVGAECAAVAVRLRREPVVPHVLGVVGSLLVILGAHRAGPGWLALALLVLSVALTAVAAVTTAPTREAVRVGGVLAAVAAWWSALSWLGWPDQRALDATAVGAAVVVLVAATLALLRRFDRGYALVWGGAALLVEVVAATDALAGTGIAFAGVQPGWMLTGSLSAVAVALGLSASRTGVPAQREIGAAYLIGAVAAAGEAADLSSTGRMWLLGALGAVAAVALLAAVGTRMQQAWQRPLLVLGWVGAAWATAAALFATEQVLLSAPLAVAALEAAATGVALRRLGPQLLSPVLACGSWVVFALDSLDGNPQWVTTPIGLATLVAVGLWRRDRDHHRKDRAAPEVVAVELSGVALLLGPALVQAVTTSILYAFLAIVGGCAVAAWGVVTHVRRRLAAGALAVLVSVLVLVGIPLVQLVPRWEGAMLWALIAALGLAAVLVAAFIERGKAAVRKGLARFGEATSGWE